MRKVLIKGLIVLVLGLVLSAPAVIAAGQDSGGTGRTGPEGIISNTSDPEIIPGTYSIQPAQAMADFRVYDIIEINVDNDIIPVGMFSGRHRGSLIIMNTPDSSQTILGNISETLEGDSFTRPEFFGNATWNSTYIHWVYPPDFVLNESDSFHADYYTGALTTVFNPVTLKRFVNQSIFVSDGFQFNSFEVNFEENTYGQYSARVAYEGNKYTNSSILFETFTTDLPLISRTNGSYFHPVSKQYMSEIIFAFNNTTIQLHRPYHFNFTAAIKLTNNAGSPVRSYPRVMLSLDQVGAYQPGTISETAILPSSLLPPHVTCTTATTNVSNLWQYRHTDSIRLAFNQTAKILEQEKIGVFRNSTHTFYLKNGTTTTTINWGASTDFPVTGDWNGDGRTEVGVFRPSSHTFYLKNGTTTTAISWGTSTDLPVTGDWNGDRRNEVGAFRPSAHTFYLKNGTTTTSVNWGISTDLPVTGDWNGDGRTDVGVFRPSAHTFYLKNGTTTTSISWGINTDLPVTGDWNGDGRTEVGVFRSSAHTFYLKNGTTTLAISWGASTDLPVTGKW
jgi:uncharacterized protein YaiE (UPF0345 family)